MTREVIAHFGTSDGMRTGSTMANNIIVTALIASAAGFDDSSLVLFSGLSSLFGFLLEVPIAYVADERGWRRSVRISFLLDFVILCFLLAAVWAGAEGSRVFFYSAMVLRSLSIALANGFERGAYQAAYLDWFEKKVKVSSSEGSSTRLFIDSFRFSLPYRLLIPIVACISFLFCQRYFSVFESALMCLFFLAISKVCRPWQDLKLGRVKNEIPSQIVKMSFSDVFMSAQSSFPDLTIYAFAWLTRNFIHAVLIAKSYHLLRELGFSGGSIFAGGSMMALAINFLNLLFSKAVFARMQTWKHIEDIRILGSGTIALLSVSGSIIFFFSENIIFQLGFLFLFCLVSLTFSDAIRFEIESDIKSIAKNNYLASWLSAGNLLQYLAYAAVASIASFSDRSPSVVIILISLALFGTIAVGLKKKTRVDLSSVPNQV